ncbi:hypothetical protein A2477_01630 [Candidatus Falkowbacteria bacterium RIFOXYC2_FULL_47_12]|uniref:Uncharacterized protein n=2 Tax=Candidatus Falkowiibacteriota TaxID=1752728 RepID=A0A1F5TN21_9BACT|nr:MAG: hypothetical protein A2242_03135 [Candidatus Falkowbacteria bacterium RIFOXYA2_FULL_47_9]OGF40247.1 MAG: hypothetical protein A2477_01630 [Candidatus Falkowbacteria bacterium RIFOXYC2_FULL_47_12]
MADKQEITVTIGEVTRWPGYFNVSLRIETFEGGQSAGDKGFKLFVKGANRELLHAQTNAEGKWFADAEANSDHNPIQFPFEKEGQKIEFVVQLDKSPVKGSESVILSTDPFAGKKRTIRMMVGTELMEDSNNEQFLLLCEVITEIEGLPQSAPFRIKDETLKIIFEDATGTDGTFTALVGIPFYPPDAKEARAPHLRAERLDATTVHSEWQQLKILPIPKAEKNPKPLTWPQAFADDSLRKKRRKHLIKTCVVYAILLVAILLWQNTVSIVIASLAVIFSLGKLQKIGVTMKVVIVGVIVFCVYSGWGGEFFALIPKSFIFAIVMAWVTSPITYWQELCYGQIRFIAEGGIITSQSFKNIHPSFLFKGAGAIILFYIVIGGGYQVLRMNGMNSDTSMYSNNNGFDFSLDTQNSSSFDSSESIGGASVMQQSAYRLITRVAILILLLIIIYAAHYWWHGSMIISYCCAAGVVAVIFGSYVFPPFWNQAGMLRGMCQWASYFLLVFIVEMPEEWYAAYKKGGKINLKEINIEKLFAWKETADVVKAVVTRKK